MKGDTLVSGKSDVSEPEKLGSPSPNDLESPTDIAGVIGKHERLKTEAVPGKRGRGRPKGSGAGAVGGSGGGDIPADLFTADTIRPFTELPFAFGNVWFKTRQFTLDPIESDTLARQGALVANLYSPGWNPKAVALIAFSLGFATIAAKKFMAYAGERSEALKIKGEGK